MAYFNDSEVEEHEHGQENGQDFYDESLGYDEEVDGADEEVNSDYRKKITKSTSKSTNFFSASFNDTNPKSMIKYHLNWFGLPFSFFAIYIYGKLIFEQMSAKLPTVIDDLMPVQVALKVRYMGAFIYFITCLIHRPFVYECRNAEGPLIVATVLELYYMLNCKDGKESCTIIELLIPISVVTLCFLRRKYFWRTFMNPWSKDKSELIKLIRSAKETAGFLDTSSL